MEIMWCYFVLLYSHVIWKFNVYSVSGECYLEKYWSVEVANRFEFAQEFLLGCDSHKCFWFIDSFCKQILNSGIFSYYSIPVMSWQRPGESLHLCSIKSTRTGSNQYHTSLEGIETTHYLTEYQLHCYCSRALKYCSSPIAACKQALC